LRLESKSQFPLWCLDPDFAETAAHRYWYSRLRLLVERFGPEIVAQRLLVVEYFPYQSLTASLPPELLPSQRFGFSLVEKAIDEGKLIVLMRSRRYWLDAVPRLATYQYIELRNPMSPYLTPNNMSQDGFDRLLAKLALSAAADAAAS